ncbi:hypothetical protein [Nocardia niigatensis]
MLSEIQPPSAGLVAYRRESYGAGRFRVIKYLAGAGQGYVLLIKDQWCGGLAVLKGMWWKPGQLRDESWEIALDRNKASQQDGLKAIYQAMQLTQQAPTIIDVLAEPSPTLEAQGILSTTTEHFVVSQFIGLDGEPVQTLQKEIETRHDRGNRFSEDELMDLAEQLCAALGALHTRRPSKTPGKREEYWIHADLKPENVLILGPPPQYILIDYDAAVLNEQPIGTTTPAYSPPIPRGSTKSDESDAAHERFDIYMLGVTLAEALTLDRLDDDLKRLLYGDEDDFSKGKQQLAQHGASPILTTLIGSCLASPDRRTRNVQSIIADLARARDTAALYKALTGQR